MHNTVSKIAFKTIKEHLFLSISLLLMVGITIYVSVLPPMMMEKIVDTIMEQVMPSLGLVGLYIGLIVLSGLLDSGKEIYITRFGQMITKELRKAMEEKLQYLPASYFVNEESGVVTSRFVNDVDSVDALFTSGIFSMVVDAGKIISILVVIFTRSLGLGILLILVLPLLYYFTRFVQKRTLASQITLRKAVAKANGLLPMTLYNIRTIKLLHSENYQLSKYASAIDESFAAQEKTNFYDSIYSPIITIICSGLIIIMMLGSASSGTFRDLFAISVGTSVMLISYLRNIFKPLDSIGMEIQNIQSALAGMKRINEFLSLDEEKCLKEELKESKMAVVLNNVSFKYASGERDILSHYNLELEQGTHVTLVGRTGAGKSTLFKLILGLYNVDEGEVLIFNQVPTSIKEEDKRSVYGYVEQSFHAINGNIEEQITLKDPTISEEAVNQALKLTGLWEQVSHYEQGIKTPYKESLFSQGQIQLLSICRAIVKNPKLLLLDEITANLDSGTEQMVLEALKKASENRTVISITHRVFGDNNEEVISLS